MYTTTTYMGHLDLRTMLTDFQFKPTPIWRGVEAEGASYCLASLLMLADDISPLLTSCVTALSAASITYDNESYRTLDLPFNACP